MRIFSDLHHFDLYHSFQLLFEGRLKCELWRPIGADWLDAGYWAINGDKEFAECMLSVKDGACAEILSKYETLSGKDWAVFSLHLPRIGKITNIGDGKYLVRDKSKDVDQRAITFAAFQNTKFDVIISSLPQHFSLFEELRKKFQPQAKHIFHMASVGWQPPADVKNIMVNSKPVGQVGAVNQVCYRQEFNLDVFNYTPPTASKTVRSYVHFPDTEILWKKLDLPWDFKFVGKTLGPIKNVVVESSKLSDEIRASGFTLHIKPGGESYGHILHNSYAMGRPLIINGKDFETTAASTLFTDDTSINVDGKSIAEIRKLVEDFSSFDEHTKLCERVYKRFKSVVDFEEDAEKVKAFLEKLV